MVWGLGPSSEDIVSVVGGQEDEHESLVGAFLLNSEVVRHCTYIIFTSSPHWLNAFSSVSRLSHVPAVSETEQLLEVGTKIMDLLESSVRYQSSFSVLHGGTFPYTVTSQPVL